MKVVAVTDVRPPHIQEWRHFADYRGGRYNLNVCRLNYPGDGAAFVAVGTSLISMGRAVRNAYRNFSRSQRNAKATP